MNWFILHIFHSALNAFAFSLILQICEGQNLANNGMQMEEVHSFCMSFGFVKNYFREKFNK